MLCFIGRSLLVLFFSYTFMNKILIFNSFLLNIAKTGIFGKQAVYFVAISALLMEGLSILLLVFSKRWGYYSSLTMMMLFTLYICWLFGLHRYEVCGCGGIMNGLSFSTHFMINLFTLTLIVVLIKLDKYEF
jgi:hypothetical protein